MKISQRDDNDTKYKIILLCKALSTDDDYWITSNLGEKWDSVNLYENHLSEAISQIALAGKSLTVTGKIHPYRLLLFIIKQPNPLKACKCIQVFLYFTGFVGYGTGVNGILLKCIPGCLTPFPGYS